MSNMIRGGLWAEGTKVTLATAAECIQEAGLDWQVTKEPVYMDGKNPDEVEQIPGHFVTRRSDTRAALGVVGAGYTPLQNRDAFKFFDAIVGEGKAIYETAGSFNGGQTVWLLAKLPENLRIIGEDVVDKYLLFANGHGGNLLAMAGLTPVRVVCKNTLNAAIAGGTENWVRLRHTCNVATKFEDAGKIMKVATVYYEEVQTQFATMAKTRVSDAQVERYFREVYHRPVAEDAQQGKEWRDLGNLRELAEEGTGQDLKGVRGTLWAAYNAVTEFEDYVRPLRETTSRMNRAMLGDGAKSKVRAFQLAVNEMTEPNLVLN